MIVLILAIQEESKPITPVLNQAQIAFFAGVDERVSRTIVGLLVAIRARSARRSGLASSLPRALKWVSRNYKKRNNQELFLYPVSFGKSFTDKN